MIFNILGYILIPFKWIMDLFRNPLLVSAQSRYGDSYASILLFNKGKPYIWSGWLGSQLKSYELLVPAPGKKIMFEFPDSKTYELTIVEAQRRGIWVKCFWRLPQPYSLDEHHKIVEEFMGSIRNCP